MRKFIGILIALVLLLTLSGCATSMVLGLKKGSYVPSGNPNKGYIYIYRTGGYFGCLRGIFVTANGKRIGGLNSGSYFVYEADPGEITISVENWLGENPSIKIMVEAGKKYYAKGSIEFGIIDATPTIDLIGEEQGEVEIRPLTYATFK